VSANRWAVAPTFSSRPRGTSPVDLEIGVITVKLSHDRVTTKGKRSDATPVAAELRPYLEHALRLFAERARVPS